MDIAIQQKRSKPWLGAHIYDNAKFCGQRLWIILGGGVEESLPVMECAPEGSPNGFEMEAGVVIVIESSPTHMPDFLPIPCTAHMKSKPWLNTQLERQIWQNGISWLDN